MILKTNIIISTLILLFGACSEDKSLKIQQISNLKFSKIKDVKLYNFDENFNGNREFFTDIIIENDNDFYHQNENKLKKMHFLNKYNYDQLPPIIKSRFDFKENYIYYEIYEDFTTTRYVLVFKNIPRVIIYEVII